MTAGNEGRLRIGTSGWQYRHWRDVFYPGGMPQREWFSHYASHFDTVEINNSFYRLPPPQTFDRWREQAPPGFVYAVKFSRYGSHLKRLTDAATTVGRFVASAEHLGPRMGPILVQLPPNFGADVGRLADFLDTAPRKFLWAFEFRHRSWFNDNVLDRLRVHRAALVVHDKIPGHPRVLTTDWTYIRYHGGHGHDGNYGRDRLHKEASNIRTMLACGHNVFVYFNNDVHGHALANAADLRRFILQE